MFFCRTEKDKQSENLPATIFSLRTQTVRDGVEMRIRQMAAVLGRQ